MRNMKSRKKNINIYLGVDGPIFNGLAAHPDSSLNRRLSVNLSSMLSRSHE